MEVRQTDVDGVRCFWVETGRPTLAAQLVFRQGAADETYPESGWLHLLEHSALHGTGGGALQVNGSVSMLHTDFEAHGPVDAVVSHLDQVTGWLSAPDLGDLDRERNVLRAESALGGGAAARAVGCRYGARGPGLVAHDEPGLGRATAPELTRLARRVFVRGNAALVLDGPPPAGLRLRLPDGELSPPTEAVVLEPTIPGAYVDEAGLVLSGVIDRSVAGTVAADVLQRLLRERLRDRAGAAYAPWATYEPVDADRAVVVGGSDVLPEHLPELAQSVVALTAALRSNPVQEAWLREAVEARQQALRDPYALTMLAARAARDHLQGRAASSQADLLDELAALDVLDVNRALRRFWQTILVGVPGETPWRDQLPMVTFPEERPTTDGATFRSADWPGSQVRLRVGRERIEVVQGERARGVDLADLAGVLVFPDGGRHLVRHDGWGIHVLPSAWNRGDQVVRAIDEVVPPGLRAPQPLPADQTWRRASFATRWWHGARYALTTTTAYWTYIVLMGCLVVTGVVLGRPLLFFGGAFAAYGAFSELRRSQDPHRVKSMI